MSYPDTPLRVSSCMAPNMEGMCRSIVDHLSHTMGMPAEFVGECAWQERERRFDEGDIDVCWLCALPYIDKFAKAPGRFELVAAPVMSGERYEGKAIYYSDVVVRDQSDFVCFEDLRDCVWAYNEPRSHSGYGIVRFQLVVRGEHSGFFGRVVESGSHQNSLKLILSGAVDASAIDSTVLEEEIRRDPELFEKIRVIGSLGPSPMPPWVINTRLPQEVRRQLRTAFLRMHRTAAGRALLDAYRVKRFAAVSDPYYDPIRSMARLSENIDLAATPA